MFEKVVDVFFSPVVQTVFIALAGLLFKSFKKYKDLYKEVSDIPKRVIKARKADSNGGVKITESEYAEIGKEIVEALEVAAKFDWKSIFKKGK